MFLIDALLQGILMGLLFALVALGLTVIFGVMDIVNFAHGEFLMLGMYTIYWINKLFGIDPLLALPASTLLGALLGVASYYWFIKYLLRGPAIAQLFGTFGLMLFLQYTAMFLFSADYRMIDKGLLVGKSLSVGPFVFDWTKLASGILSLIAFAIVYYFINKTKTGKAIQATALNKEAASYMGIKTERMNAIAWAIGGATVGTAGGLLVNFYYAYPMVGILFVMIAFACVALGGFGSIKGVFFAGLLIGILEMTFPVFGQIIGSDFLGPHFKFTVVYLAYFIIVVVRPQGLFGWKN
ncbi:MAG TPA: branched-chain amino acid ABC transporter permease [Syntrophorhabdaceae bacterium]|jgi:branched-chain amino acid transport system permease protein|nr:branched-chain amino acid ABC transporter permease [Syntrophorhabdaceae bacterium]MBV6506653.1 High-affinity branched-chain amino acid transport system permease protein LivH [Syntrophorhabdaceae bacterium]HNQ63031.1 branched-chain amino acid ABC transporter permease [Syntrophorhabdaceae bacterium]HNZ58603.1 branched-chain amino acid ABC transporter permease [Syntrophorhabdaceae bacterium]HOB68678.1 branched-chain amino acid ABC transporter permease [Syntrophorhabdaceae bacterium]